MAQYSTACSCFYVTQSTITRHTLTTHATVVQTSTVCETQTAAIDATLTVTPPTTVSTPTAVQTDVVDEVPTTITTITTIDPPPRPTARSFATPMTGSGSSEVWRQANTHKLPTLARFYGNIPPTVLAFAGDSFPAMPSMRVFSRRKNFKGTRFRSTFTSSPSATNGSASCLFLKMRTSRTTMLRIRTPWYHISTILDQNVSYGSEGVRICMTEK
jgi:hypothetical protein